MENIKRQYLEELQEPEEEGVLEEELLGEIQEFLTEVLNEEIPIEKVAYRLEQLVFNPVNDPEIDFRIARYYILLNIMISRRKVLEADSCEELVSAVVSLELGRERLRNLGEKWKPIH